MNLDGRAAIVTGGARGIGKGVAVAFAKAGADVLIVDREAALGRETETELKAIRPKSFFLEFDLAQHERLSEIVDAAVERFGKLDILANVAQAGVILPILDQTLEQAKVGIDTGFLPTFMLMKAAHPHLKKSGGNIVNFGSGALLSGVPHQATYAAAKEAIRGLTKIAATEWGPDGIRVNLVSPFAMSPGVAQWKQYDPAGFALGMERIPLGRGGDCETDIGEAVVFLASDSARYITGHTLMVDGGQTKVF